MGFKSEGWALLICICSIWVCLPFAVWEICCWGWFEWLRMKLIYKSLPLPYNNTMTEHNDFHLTGLPLKKSFEIWEERKMFVGILSNHGRTLMLQALAPSSVREHWESFLNLVPSFVFFWAHCLNNNIMYIQPIHINTLHISILLF